MTLEALFTRATTAALTLGALVVFDGVASAQTDVDCRVVGQVTALSPAPSSGPFASALVGDAVTLRLSLTVPGTPSATQPSTAYLAAPALSTLTVGALSDTLQLGGAPLLGVWNSWLGNRDRVSFFNQPLESGGLVRVEMLDTTDTVFDTTDIRLLRGIVPAAGFTNVSFGAQVGGGFLEFDVAQIEFGNAGLGDVYCAPAIPNSTGFPGLFQVTGSTSIAANFLQLEARRLPPGTFGLFVTSMTQGNVASPGGSQGVLCLSGMIGRFNAQVFNAGVDGSALLPIAPDTLPGPQSFVAAQVGETWNFQAWYRDNNPTVTSNFTDAVAVTFVP